MNLSTQARSAPRSFDWQPPSLLGRDLGSLSPNAATRPICTLLTHPGQNPSSPGVYRREISAPKGIGVPGSSSLWALLLRRLDSSLPTLGLGAPAPHQVRYLLPSWLPRSGLVSGPAVPKGCGPLKAGFHLPQPGSFTHWLAPGENKKDKQQLIRPSSRYLCFVPSRSVALITLCYRYLLPFL